MNRNQALVIVFAILIGFAGVCFYGQPKTGILQVNVDPSSLHPNIEVDGAVIGSAPVEKTLSVGNHTVVAGDVSGYVTPKPLKVAIEQGRKTTIIFTYTTTGVTPTPPPTQTTGMLYVKTDPVEGEIFVQGQSKGRGAIMVDLAPGSYLVTFGAVAGYTAPAGQTAIVQSGQMTTIMVKYQAVASPSKATMSVTTQPVQGPILIDAVQRGVGSVNWQVDVGATVKVSFGVVAGYSAPPDQTVTATQATTYTVTGTYTVLSTVTQAKITISAVDENNRVLSSAQIFVDDVLKGSGTVTVSGLTYGTHTISFGSVAGYVTPKPQTFLNYGDALTFSGKYVPVGVSTYRVTVFVDYYSVMLGRTIPLESETVKAYQGDVLVTSAITGSEGVAILVLPAGTYKVSCTTLSYGTQSATVTVPPDASVELRYVGSGLSIIPIGGVGVESTLLVLAIAIALLLIALLWRPRRGQLRRRR